MIRTLCLLGGVLAANAAAALELPLPAGTEQVLSLAPAADNYAMPTGPYAQGIVPNEEIEGLRSVSVWRAPPQSSYRVMSALIDGLKAQDIEIIFSCDTLTCGGFDFRFATYVAPGPEMFVNLRDFRFLSARLPDGGAMTLLVSQTSNRTYVQMVQISPDSVGETPETVTPAPEVTAAPQISYATPLLQRMLSVGHAVLDDLTFETGASTLGKGPFASLEVLAGYLKEHPTAQVVLVGHTDSVGSLSANTSLSKVRAQAVRRSLLDRYGVAPAQVDAQGAGYLAPVASNMENAGREANRRVEVVLLKQ